MGFLPGNLYVMEAKLLAGDRARLRPSREQNSSTRELKDSRMLQLERRCSLGFFLSSFGDTESFSDTDSFGHTDSFSDAYPSADK